MSNIKKILMLLSLLIINSQTLSSKNWIANENGVTPTFYLVCVLVVIAFLGGLFIYIPILRNYEKRIIITTSNVYMCVERLFSIKHYYTRVLR